MTIAVKRILLLTRDVQFAINVKRALESLGEYAVTPVTEARNAIEQLRRKPHHLVLLDIENLAIAPAVMIDLIRARQGEIAIVLAPDNRAARELAQEYRAQGVVDIPVATRFLIPVLEGSIKDIYEALPQTARLSSIEMQEDTVNIESLVDGLLVDQAMPSYTLQKLQASYRLLHPTDDDLKAGPPPDGFELAIEPDDDGDTIRYRRLRSEDQDRSTTGKEDEDTPLSSADAQTTVRDLARALSNPALGLSEFATTVPDAQHIETENLGRILRDIENENTTIENLSGAGRYEDFGRRLSDELDRQSQIGYGHDILRKPSVSQEHLLAIDAPGHLGQTTLPAVSHGPGGMATTGAASTATAARSAAASGSMQAPLYGRVEDPYIRQVAVVMTQMMTELTAEATLLTRDNAMLAYSGALQPDDLNALRKAINDDWTAKPNRSRLRFLTLPNDGRQFMLFSKGTLDDLTLSLVFAGDQSLSAINRQGDRMLQAMAQVPAVDVKTEEADSDSKPTRSLADAPESAARSTQALAFVWLVADPASPLSQSVAKQLVFWMEAQLNNLGWTVRRIDVHQDFVYLVADIPGGAAPDQIAKDLMARSARIARAEDQRLPGALWADAYLVLQPGRDLDLRELQGFLSFVRAEN
ncbi:MAG: hypothetical protein OXT68_07885 [Chloroflexota bacterium]|nr:hypothetical protein [Chloroflexota bacterium]